MKKVLVLVGPTGIGKTKLSIDIAKHFNLEIISGDSVAVYKELDIGSAKIKKEEMQGIKHHLIDVLDPIESYSTFDFQQNARKLINELDKPFIVGGTGLYIQSCLFDYEFTSPKRDSSFEENLIDISNEELYEELLSLDPDVESIIHVNNRKRIIRALEVIKSSGKKFSSFNNKTMPLYDAYIICLTANRDYLYDRINQRVDLMINEGLIEEAKALFDKGIYKDSIGYKELNLYFKGDVSLDIAIDEIKKNSRHLAKRQITWFKNQMNSHFYEITSSNYDLILNQIIKDVEEFYLQ